MLVILEVILIGGPVVTASVGRANTTAAFLVVTVICCVTALSAFLPLTFSKLLLLRDGERMSTLFHSSASFRHPGPEVSLHPRNSLRITNRQPSQLRSTSFGAGSSELPLRMSNGVHPTLLATQAPFTVHSTPRASLRRPTGCPSPTMGSSWASRSGSRL